MSRKQLRIGPVSVDVEFRELRCVLQGLRSALGRGLGSRPIDPSRIPDGWELRRSEWPSSWLRATGYWVSIWRSSSATGEHVSVQPDPDGWRVKYNPENSWMGGPVVARRLEYAEALDVATDVASRVNEGADKSDLRRYDRGGGAGGD